MNGERDWQWKVVEQFVFHILRIVLQRLRLFILSKCVKQLCVIFFLQRDAVCNIKRCGCLINMFQIMGFFYTRECCKWNKFVNEMKNKPEMLKLLLVLFLSALTLNEKPVINSD